MELQRRTKRSILVRKRLQKLKFVPLKSGRSFRSKIGLNFLRKCQRKNRFLLLARGRRSSIKSCLTLGELHSTIKYQLNVIFSCRYLLLTSKERKQVFEKYVKERAEEERREKRNKLREKKEAFKKLLTEAHLHGKCVNALIMNFLG